jgi:hypothetical protein
MIMRGDCFDTLPLFARLPGGTLMMTHWKTTVRGAYSGHGRGSDEDFSSPTGSPEAVTRPRLPRNVACEFPAPRSSAVGSQLSPGFIGTLNLSDSPRRPACPSRASGWSSLTTPWGLSCCVRFPCVHAVATTPAQRLSAFLCSFHPPVSAFPERVVGSACALSFSRLARRLLARPAHSRCHRIS